MEVHTVKGIATQAVRRLDRSGLRRNGFKRVHFHAELGIKKQVEFKAEITSASFRYPPAIMALIVEVDLQSATLWTWKK